MSTDLYRALREEAWEANQELPRHGLVQFTFGNASAFDPDLGVFAIKPSGVPYDGLLAADMVVVDLEAKIVDGSMRPSSDTKTHAVLYREFAGIRGIAHTHSTHAVAWAQALRDIPLYGTTHADHLPVPVPCSDVLEHDRVFGNYEWETGLQIVEMFQDRGLSPNDVPMALVGGHGPFTWGASAAKAVYHSVVLEELARMAILTESVNPSARPLAKALVDRHFSRKHGDGAYYGQ